MIVSQLIEKLRRLPQDARVVVTGYEGGCTEPNPESPSVVLMHVNYRESGYTGEHEICDTPEYPRSAPENYCYCCKNDDKTRQTVVLIDR